MIFSDLDFSTLQDIPPLQRYYDMPRVSVSEKGLVSMNGAFRKEAGTQRTFRSQIGPDGRYLVFYPTETPNIRFSAKGGSVTHVDLAKYLVEKGILLPAVYSMTWCRERQAWVAFLCAYRGNPGAFSSTHSHGWEQAYLMISDALAEARRQNHFWLYSQTSLDQPVSYETAVPRAHLLTAPHGDFQNSVCFRDCLQHMEQNVRRMAYELINGSSISEIQSDYGWHSNYIRYHRLTRGDTPASGLN